MTYRAERMKSLLEDTNSRVSHTAKQMDVVRASEHGYFSRVLELLFRSGAAPATNDLNLALHAAAKNGHEDVVKLLISNGAQIDSQNPHLNGNTALMHAAAFGKKSTVRLLLENGANINLQNMQGMTALHEAAKFDCLGVSKLLLSMNADVAIKDQFGQTPVQVASGSCRRLLMTVKATEKEVLQVVDNTVDDGLVFTVHGEPAMLRRPAEMQTLG